MERSDWSEFSCDGATSTRGPGNAAENPAYLGWVIGIDPGGGRGGPPSALGKAMKHNICLPAGDGGL